MRAVRACVLITATTGKYLARTVTILRIEAFYNVTLIAKYRIQYQYLRYTFVVVYLNVDSPTPIIYSVRKISGKSYTNGDVIIC